MFDTHSLSERIFEIEDRYELAKRAAGFGVWDWNMETGALEWDSEMHALFGTSEDTWPNNYDGFKNQLCPDDVAECERRIAHSIQYGSPYKYRFTAKNGRHIYGLGKVYYRGNVACRMVGVCLPCYDNSDTP